MRPVWFNIELPDRYNELLTLFPAEVLALSYILAEVIGAYALASDKRLVKEARWLAMQAKIEHIHLKKELPNAESQANDGEVQNPRVQAACLSRAGVLLEVQAEAAQPEGRGD